MSDPLLLVPLFVTLAGALVAAAAGLGVLKKADIGNDENLRLPVRRPEKVRSGSPTKALEID